SPPPQGGSVNGGTVLPPIVGVVTGFFTDSATFAADDPLPNLPVPLTADSASEDIFVAALRDDGTLAFARRAGGAGADRGTAVAAFPDGSFVVTGFFTGTAVFGEDGFMPNPTTLQSAGFVASGLSDEDMFVAR